MDNDSLQKAACLILTDRNKLYSVLVKFTSQELAQS